jgi:hypothetical protein
MASVSGAYQRQIEPALGQAGLMAHVSVSDPDSVLLPLFELAKHIDEVLVACLCTRNRAVNLIFRRLSFPDKNSVRISELNVD